MNISFITKENWFHFVFTGALLLFIIAKIPTLDLPFFWDELGVYGRITFGLADRPLTMHPGALDQWLTRGHPLLYPFIESIFCKIFGTTVTVAHMGNVFISVILLLCVYLQVGKMFNWRTGLLASIILGVQPIFFAQAGLVLPEITLTLFLWLSTVFYLRKAWLPYFLCGSAAALTKEPAIVWIGGVFLFDLIARNDGSRWHSIFWLAPLVPFAAFLVVQKITLGWYLFPYHTGGFDLTLQPVVQKASKYLQFLFLDQGRWTWLLVIVAFVFVTIAINPEKRSAQQTHPIGIKTTRLFVWLTMLFTVFHFTTFDMHRYLLPVYPLLSVIVAWIIFAKAYNMHKVVALALIVFLVITPLTQMNSRKFANDTDMSYTLTVDAMKQTVDYMIDNEISATRNYVANIPLSYAFADRRLGYLDSAHQVRYRSQLSDKTQHVVIMKPGVTLKIPDEFSPELKERLQFQTVNVEVFETNRDN